MEAVEAVAWATFAVLGGGIMVGPLLLAVVAGALLAPEDGKGEGEGGESGGTMTNEEACPQGAKDCAAEVDSSPSGTEGQEARSAPLPLPPLDTIHPEHIAYVRSVVGRFSVTPPHWRQDLVQEALGEAYRSRDSRLDVRALLFGVTRHIVLQWRARRRAERAGAGMLPATEPVTDCTALDDLLMSERREIVDAAIGELPAIFREVFQRVEIHGMPMAAVVRALRIPLNTGYTRLYLARARFLVSIHRILARRRVEGSAL